ncbi:MAG: hypothetical protein O7G88_23120, partial [bacterium]|nr:hypothetical protein [bacterium]
MPFILTINAGSSSIKFQCFEMEGEASFDAINRDSKPLAKGQIDRLNSPNASLLYERHDGVTSQTKVPRMEYGKIFRLIFQILLDPALIFHLIEEHQMLP